MFRFMTCYFTQMGAFSELFRGSFGALSRCLREVFNARKSPEGARNSAAGGTFRGFHQGYYLGQRVGVRIVKELLLQLHRAAKELAGSLRIRRTHTVQFTA